MKKNFKKRLIILTILILLILVFLFTYIIYLNPNIKINSFQRLSASKSIITYSILNKLENPECILNINKGNQEKLEFPLSCPGAISPKGNHICNFQSHSAILGQNQITIWETIINLTDVKNIQICCINSDVPINSPENLDLTKKDFICSKPYKI